MQNITINNKEYFIKTVVLIQLLIQISRDITQESVIDVQHCLYEVLERSFGYKQEIKEADRTEKICDNYLLSKTKLKPAVLKKVKNKQEEWYFDVNTAKKYGLVDEII